MTHIITAAEQMTPDMLTSVLRRAGVLPQGQVEHVEYQANPAFNSTVTHLTLTYSSDAPPTAPTRLVLKRNIPADWALDAGRREVLFYQAIEGLPDRLPMLPRCYDAHYDSEAGNSHVLLQDVSATHRVAMSRDEGMRVGQNMPPASDVDAVIGALAQFHASWWEHPLLGTPFAQVGVWWQDQAHYEHEIERRTRSFADLIEGEVAWFPEHLHRLYERALAGLPTLWKHAHAPRLATRRHLTITHNDAYFANFMCPNQGTTGETYIIDWQGPAMGRGADDLANLMATFWTPAQRNAERRETALLRRYHDLLCAYGVQDYAWDDLRSDYQLSVIEWLFQPLQDRMDGADRAYWWPKMQCLAGAFEDLRCADLLQPS